MRKLVLVLYNVGLFVGAMGFMVTLVSGWPWDYLLTGPSIFIGVVFWSLWLYLAKALAKKEEEEETPVGGLT